MELGMHGAGQGGGLLVTVLFGRDCYPLWVGNITFKITKKVLQSCFSR